MKVSEHFNKYEFYCKGNKRGVCKCNQSIVDAELLIVLEDLRSHFGLPIKIYSGYRCPKYNSYVGGAKRSKHRLGIASDIRIFGVRPKKVYEYLNEKYPNKYGIGNYDNFTHIDIRSNKARWHG